MYADAPYKQIGGAISQPRNLAHLASVKMPRTIMLRVAAFFTRSRTSAKDRRQVHGARTSAALNIAPRRSDHREDIREHHCAPDDALEGDAEAVTNT